MQEKTEINVVNDQYGTPTYAADLAAVLLQIIKCGKWQSGIYHYSNDGITTWYQFAMAIKSIKEYSCAVNPIPTASFPTPAKRPAYSVLNKSKIKEAYHIQPPHWRDSLVECLKILV